MHMVDVEDSDVVGVVATTFEYAVVALVSLRGKKLDQQGFDVQFLNTAVRINLETLARCVETVFFVKVGGALF